MNTNGYCSHNNQKVCQAMRCSCHWCYEYHMIIQSENVLIANRICKLNIGKLLIKAIKGLFGDVVLVVQWTNEYLNHLVKSCILAMLVIYFPELMTFLDWCSGRCIFPLICSKGENSFVPLVLISLQFV